MVLLLGLQTEMVGNMTGMSRTLLDEIQNGCFTRDLDEDQDIQKIRRINILNVKHSHTSIITNSTENSKNRMVRRIIFMHFVTVVSSLCSVNEQHLTGGFPQFCFLFFPPPHSFNVRNKFWEDGKSTVYTVGYIHIFFLFLHAVLFYFKLSFDWKVMTLLGWNQKAETRINGACHSIQNSIQSVPTMDMGIFLSLLATLFNEMGVLSFSDHSKFHNLK